MCFEKNEKSCVARENFILNLFIAMILTGLYISEMRERAILGFVFSLTVRNGNRRAARFLIRGKCNKLKLFGKE